MKIGRVAWLVGVALLVMVVNVALSVLYMVVYSYLTGPGHDEKYYNDHIQVAAPYCSIVAGMPLMFLAGWWVSRWWERAHAVRSAFIVWLVYVVIDFSVLLAAGLNSKIALLFGVSFVTKLAAVILGARFGRRNV